MSLPVSEFKEGALLLVDKPKTWTSFDVVKKIRYSLKIKKVGHAGTLDPLATGLLIVATGKYTKKIEEVQSQTKEYNGLICLGKTTPSYDLETEFDSEKDISHLSMDSIEEVVEQFRGEIEQYPPMHSAVKVDGVRAYKKARKNEQVELKPRQVMIHEFSILSWQLPFLEFRIRCSKGTYIRSIANDVGKSLGVGGYLHLLRRTKIGEYSVDDAHDLSSLIDQIKSSDENH